ncbi:MAG TPA: COX15/CtaA family protein [Candidatus Bathyarchaeia archaeon]|nr:COX15/CtaA family protein [Candidatus Bathyarchaeia archaeon]
MSISNGGRSTLSLRVLAYGSVLSTYVLILIGGYVTTTNSGLGCGESWPLCSGAVLPSLNDVSQIIEFTHRIFNFVVAFFVLGMSILVWTRYREEKNLFQLSTASFLALMAQVLLGGFTVTTSLNPVISDAHLGLASAVFGLLVANAVTVWNLTRRPTEVFRRITGNSRVITSA